MRRFGWVLALVGCGGSDPDPVISRGEEPAVAPAPATLRKLTRAEYLDTLTDLLGPDVVLPAQLEPDAEVGGLLSVGAGQAAISPLGVEQYETAAYALAGQVARDEALRERVVGCTPTEVADTACLEGFVRGFGRLAWRRALTEDEVAALVGVGAEAAAVLDDPLAGPEYALAALLQSPSFLYRVELGQGGRFSGVEVASRLSYLLWNGPPDLALLEVAESGELDDPEVLAAQVDRMLADPKAERGLRAFFDQWLELWKLPSLTKDPTLFVHFSDALGPSAREETLRVATGLARDPDADFRDLLTTRRTFLDRTLAALYSVPAPAREGFAPAELPADGPRLGLLGQASFLALHSHPVSTSVTRRGLFVRETLLCQTIPPPPSNVDTSIPEPSPDAATMRDRVAIHLEDPACASCHTITDPIGLGLEHFDGIGRWRPDDQGHEIDASGDLDGVPFTDARGLAVAMRENPDFVRCVAQTLLEHAQGHVLSFPEANLATWHAQGFVAEGHAFDALLRDLVTAEAFRVAGQEAR